ncbi:MAG: 23S rRNA (adenine(2503)-C(2))-methyltransferase RlmN [Sulfurovum sp.]|nr:23S rRNA (adenine(2503)-C(2))-methyltransferase RlmN [Sulfurovum sp.]MCB4744091.1 23S rRNA (adenine(2503)-C(2))-methyltransferase RlmN [Sulfurovum sp.]MCB4746772.1 23S rRNA (adenine(2503)-C(2))-methyltransferase RlmN [Sulfurovum sp.]MCB4748868.1 23S rRNA (adenine(2503)-C(2))-methyltransferase RlmN [Sulfurovum sp.]MCB4749961.1 23S rRNA (adenine(2503)-C(2))-methyltransferase RlmN [Sulfurovum sp.]
MKKQIIQDFTKEELTQKIKPAFRAKQIYQWVYHKYAIDFEEMKNLPKIMREELSQEYILTPLKIAVVQDSIDGSRKYLFELHDGYTVEAVLLLMRKKVYHEDGSVKHQERYTVCISSQVGCKVGCTFCLTAKGGFTRNLTPGEIVEQLRMIKKDNHIAANRRVNIVFMGMGEPLDNMEAVTKSIKIFADNEGMAIAPHRQTISTSGLSSKIEKLGKLGLGVNLAISLHAVDDKLRQQLMPINKAYNIESIIAAVKHFPINERKRVMFEYLVIKDINDDISAAKKLLKLLNGIKAKVNLIYFNPYGGTEFKRPSEADMKKFQEYLTKRGLHCTIRESKGLDISAACGQLREQEIEGENNG